MLPSQRWDTAVCKVSSLAADSTCGEFVCATISRSRFVPVVQSGHREFAVSDRNSSKVKLEDKQPICPATAPRQGYGMVGPGPDE